MADSRGSSDSNRAWGDAAVDGLLAGLAAGLLMAAYLWLAGLLQGVSIGALFARFDPGQPASPLTGALVHLAVSGVYGVAYGLGLKLAGGLPLAQRAPGWLLGAAYGLALLGVAYGVVLPGTGSPLRELPPIHLAAAHLLYGLALGRLAGRR
jgi:hypothetical protein